ncbi:MAG TPA: hypothetical protein VGK52_02815 [Polyangia bacterium]|jgi:hypothetical protein
MEIPRRTGGAGWLMALGAFALALAGCATARVSAERRPDGSEHLRCRTALPACLVEAERLCEGRHYIVLRALDEHDHRGSQLYDDVRTSEAIVRCGPPMAWPPGVEPMALPAETGAGPPAPPPSASAPSPAPPRACVPGSTQACVGPAGCQGGQACLADGAGFGPCDCGAAATAPR